MLVALACGVCIVTGSRSTRSCSCLTAWPHAWPLCRLFGQRFLMQVPALKVGSFYRKSAGRFKVCRSFGQTRLKTRHQILESNVFPEAFEIKCLRPPGGAGVGGLSSMTALQRQPRNDDGAATSAWARRWRCNFGPGSTMALQLQAGLDDGAATSAWAR